MKEKTMHSIKFLGLTLGIALSIFAISLAVYAWTAPTATPPTCPAGSPGCDAPVHVGTTTQTKVGALGVGGVFTANSAVHLAVGGGNVGIGTAVPGARLQVTGVRNSIISTTTAVSKIGGGDVHLYTNAMNSGSWGVWMQVLNDAGGLFPLALNPSGGNVGIGTSDPTARLDIEGQIRIRGGSPAAGRVLTSGADGTATWTVPAGGLPTGTTGQTLRHDGTNWVANSALFNNGTNIGIGTTVPGERLEVAGNIRLAGASPTHRITNLASPIAANDAATRAYVDANVGGGGVLITWGWWEGNNPAAGTGAPACPSGWTQVYAGLAWIPQYAAGGTTGSGVGEKHCNAGTVGMGMVHQNIHYAWFIWEQVMEA